MKTLTIWGVTTNLQRDSQTDISWQDTTQILLSTRAPTIIISSVIYEIIPKLLYFSAETVSNSSSIYSDYIYLHVKIGFCSTNIYQRNQLPTILPL